MNPLEPIHLPDYPRGHEALAVEQGRAVARVAPYSSPSASPIVERLVYPIDTTFRERDTGEGGGKGGGNCYIQTLHLYGNAPSGYHAAESLSGAGAT